MAAPAAVHHHHRRGMASRFNVVDHDGIGAAPCGEERKHLLQRAAIHNGGAGIKAPGEIVEGGDCLIRPGAHGRRSTASRMASATLQSASARLSWA